MRAEQLARAGAMRSLAALFSADDPDVAALSGIDAGDALATATRFDREWAYRGRQALLWKRRMTAHAVHDFYLPVSALRPFDRRGLLCVDADAGNVPLHLFATQFAGGRTAIRDLRFARTAVRSVDGNVVLFISEPGSSRIGFADAGLQSVVPAPKLAIWARGFRLDVERYSEDEPGLGAVAVAHACATV
ncbi:MAG TPA: hypothetical protein VGG89_05935 [Candidatus Baltobacteraceae bacterium]